MIKSTRTRDKINLKKSILDAARTLFLHNGYSATSMRKIAAEIGISPTTIYLYYEDKAEIMHALHQEGFKLLTQEFKTLANVENPYERLKAMGRSYIGFALENPDFYDIMFVMKEPLEHVRTGDAVAASCEGAGWEEGEAAFQALLTTVLDCQEKGYFGGYDTKILALLIWSNMHGLCALNNDGRLQLLAGKLGGDVDVSKVLMHSFEIYAAMLEKI